MAVITRITDFIPNTLIESQEVDDEFNQLVNLLSGVSTNKDTLLKYSHATDPVLRVDQLGAGLIQQWLQNGAVKARVNNDGSFNIGTPGGSPTAGMVAGPDSSGTNIAGANLIVAGGKGTGSAIAGLPVFKYPLYTASGTTLQALSAGSFPPASNVGIRWTDTTVANTTTETSLLAAVDAGTATLEGGMASAGKYFRVRAYGQVGTTGTPNLRIRLKLGAATIADTGNTITMANNTASGAGGFVLDALVAVEVAGSSGTVLTSLNYRYPAANGGSLNQVATAVNTTTLDLTTNRTWDLSAEWSAASASNSLTIFAVIIEMSR